MRVDEKLKKTVQYMLSNNLTVSDLAPEVQQQLAEDDKLVHYVSKYVSENSSPREAQANLDGTLEQLGVDRAELDRRTTAGHRFQTGVASTVSAIGAGVVNAYDYVTGEEQDDEDTTSRVADSLDAEGERDSKLYKSLNLRPEYEPTVGGDVTSMIPTESGKTRQALDIATTVGAEAPGAVVGGLAGKAVKTGMAMESGVEGMRIAGENEPSSRGETLTRLLAPLVGFGLAKQLEKFTGKVFKSVEDYEAAVRAEPHLEEQMMKMAKEKGIDMNDLKAKNKPEDYNKYGLDDNELVEGVVEAELRSTQPTTLKELQTTRDDLYETHLQKAGEKAIPEAEFIELYNKRYITTLAQNAKTGEDFIESIATHADVLEDLGYKDMVSWARNTKKLSGSAQQKAFEDAGLGTMLLAVGMPGVRHVLPDVVNKWMSKGFRAGTNAGKKLLTKPFGSQSL